MAIDSVEYLGARERLGVHHVRLAPEPAATSEERFDSTLEALEKAEKESDFFGEDGFTFGDFLDLINPLQHLPVISTIYRAISGDEISQGSRILGGAIFGGPIGLASAVANAAVEQATGKDIGALALSIFDSDETDAGDPPATAIAAGAVPDDMVPSPSPEPSGAEAAALDNIDAPPNSHGATNEYVAPELSEEQRALLFSSVGLSPDGRPMAPALGSSGAPSRAGSRPPEAVARGDPHGVPNSSRRVNTDYVRELSEEQKALLFSSVGLAPDGKPAQPVATRTPRPSAAAAPATVTTGSTPSVSPVAARTGVIPNPAALHQMASRRLNSPEIGPGGRQTINAHLSSPEWIARAMEMALDKYSANAANGARRGQTVNSGI
jgi:hypothetical protein